MREGETIEGSRTMRNRPYQVLQVLKHSTLYILYTLPQTRVRMGSPGYSLVANFDESVLDMDDGARGVERFYSLFLGVV